MKVFFFVKKIAVRCFVYSHESFYCISYCGWTGPGRKLNTLCFDDKIEWISKMYIILSQPVKWQEVMFMLTCIDKATYPFETQFCLNFSSDASFQSRLSTCLCKPAFLYINRRHALRASKSVCKVYFPLLCIIYVLFPKTIRALAVNAVKYVSMYEWANMIYNWKFSDFICITHDIAKDSLKTFSYKYVCLFT